VPPGNVAEHVHESAAGSRYAYVASR